MTFFQKSFRKDIFGKLPFMYCVGVGNHIFKVVKELQVFFSLQESLVRKMYKKLNIKMKIETIL